jgi:IMP dehydrogenase
MDTVTEAEMALAMAKMGGMGIIHRNLDAETQAAMVTWVRRKIHYGGMIDKPITFKQSDRFSTLQREIQTKGWTFTSFPVVDDNDKLIGLLTRDDMDFVEGSNPTLGELMKTRAQIVTTHEGTTTIEAYNIMKKQKVKKLPVVSASEVLVGMYVWNDVKRDQKKRDSFSLDSDGHFLVGAAIGLGKDDIPRSELLVQHGCKVLVLDSSHGACKPARDQVQRLREKFGDKIEIVVGNIASYDSAKYLLEADHKPDALKVGIGPGSICTTRSVTGHGIPQVTAIYEVHRAIQEYGAKTGYYVPIIADGGVRTSGDIVKCFAVGASAIMLGSVFAGTDESPGQVIISGGKRFKPIRGMGSRSAMEERSGSRVRYYRQDEKQHVAESLTDEQKQKVVPEGVEGVVEYKGSVEKVMNELIGGVQAGLAHSGGGDVASFQSKATLWMQSFAGLAEGNPHNVHNIGV